MFKVERIRNTYYKQIDSNKYREFLRGDRALIQILWPATHPIFLYIGHGKSELKYYL